MWRTSSPGAYSLCSANSTDWPCCGLWWRPGSTPSITLRARTWSGPTRARSCGSSAIVFASALVLGRQDVRERRRRAGGGGAQDLQLLLRARVPDVGHEHEAVELRLGQGVGALLLDGVLRREDEERLVGRIGGAAGGHPLLLQRL